jgi:ABC-type Fe2+-enterobactin transport system substrate-binding protein
LCGIGIIKTKEGRASYHLWTGHVHQRRLLQDLGFMGFTLPEVAILMPTKQPRGQLLTLDQQRINRSLNERRLRIEHVNSSIKRCRIAKDRLRLWKQGIRDRVMEICCGLHNFRVRLNPWQPMI